MEFGGTMSELKATLPQYLITKGKIELGIALSIGTPIERIDDYIEHITAVQLMGIATIGSQGQPFDPILQLRGSTNMAAVHLARAVGGDVFFSFICAVALATILAVVSGLTLAGASAVSHGFFLSRSSSR